LREERFRRAESAFWASYDARPTERWLELARPATRARAVEFGEGPPLLFLHGGPGAGTIFAPIVSLLNDFRCIAIDRPGCALSPPIPPPGLRVPETMAEVLRSCLDSLGIERARIVTSSFGGTCALWLALRHPERVARICHLGCPGFLAGSNLPFMIRVLATPLLGYVAARLPMNRRGVLAFLRSMGEGRLIDAGLVPESFVDFWMSLVNDTDTMQNDREMIRSAASFRGLPSELVLPDEAITAMDIPTYFYWGADEPFGTAEYATSLASGMRDGAIDIVPEVGHIPWLGEREDCAARIRSFMKNV
jgi:pimeloyl-ACP methyl ester carboxylesterase